jgi:two-component system, OmpR family, sensor histidine kinase BaeS
MLAGQPGSRARRALAAGRGALIGGPAIVAVCWLLTTANPVFRSWFDLAPLARHALLIAVGAWAVLGLGRATSAGHRILVTRGLTYAQYARSGFFQLLACAAITLVVLLSVRACSRPCRQLLTALCAVTIALTLGVVFSAISRLELYEAAFGLTLLRLACLAAACWIAVIFLLLAATLPRRGLAARYFPAAMVISGLTAVAVWAIVNPAGIVARTDVHRAQGGRPLDVSQLAGLGPDAVPALTAAVPELSPADATPLRQALCTAGRVSAAGAALNLSRRSADDALARLCDPARG